MAILKSEKMEKDAVEMGASMMAITARTAPKGRGIDSVHYREASACGREASQLREEA